MQTRPNPKETEGANGGGQEKETRDDGQIVRERATEKGKGRTE